MIRLLVIFILISWAHGYSALAQNIQIDSFHLYKFWLTTSVGSSPVKPGYLYLADSGCLSLTSMYKRELANSGNTWCTPVHQIKYIEYRREGKVGESALIGGLIGLAMGVITGFALGDDPPCQNSNPNNSIASITYSLCMASWLSAEEKALIFSIPGTGLGVTIGALLGMNKMIIPISGLNSNYQNFRPLLKTYEIRN